MKSLLTLDDVYTLYKIDHSLKSGGMFIMHHNNHSIQELLGFRHQFDGLLLSFVLTGTVRARIHFLEHDVNKGDVVVMLPQLMIDIQKFSKNSEMLTIGLSLDYISAFPTLREFITSDQLRWQPVIQLKKEELILQQEFINFMRKYYLNSKSSKKDEILRYFTFALITSISEEFPGLSQSMNCSISRTQEIIDDLYALLSKHASQQRTVKFYAQKLNLTPQYLTTLVKQETGKSVLQWIDHVFTIRAKSTLKISNSSIKEISNEFHFTDVSSFCRYFKRNTGLSPKKFRDG
ncbi:helix-turn-helix domain-containing protein [Pedobacter caeni]|uniref:AraC-type DNA-binding protein n=1 Tax=Pedobacter caeni TaxID=288992 RepID=A0A1M5BZW3_9SPHI|nr:AraC family transcriptional regulator [Pedobacter caeni]SHF48084.1 AraC-type DNA-binding protein [Pedobacter caeni]